MVWIGQFKIAKSLHSLIKSKKLFLVDDYFIELTFPEWLELASLIVLNLLGECPDWQAAKKLGVRDKAWLVFNKILRGEI